MLDAPNPTSSSMTSTTFGAPAGAVTGRGNTPLESFDRRPTTPWNGSGAIGRTVRSSRRGLSLVTVVRWLVTRT